MTDVFQEVDEQLRSARLQAVLARGWPYVAALLVAALIVMGVVWAWRAHQTQAAGQASERYAAATDALQRHDVAAAGRAFDALSRSAPPAYRALALMQQAGIKLDARDDRGAVALLDQAAGVAPNPLIGDSARLEAAYAVMDLGSYDDARRRLSELSGTGRPYRTAAREALGVAELAAGRTAEAKGDLQVVSLSADATEQQRARASAALALIQSGGASSIPALARAAADLKPQALPLPTSPSAAPASPSGAAP